MNKKKNEKINKSYLIVFYKKKYFIKRKKKVI